MKKILHPSDGRSPGGFNKFRASRLRYLNGIVTLLTFFLLTIASNASAQTIGVAGIVKDEHGIPMPGVNVTIKSTTSAVTTDKNGYYKITLQNNNAILVYTFLGYKTKEIAINGKSELNVELAPDNRNLDEVVVVGYGTQKKSDLTGSLSGISQKDYKDEPVTRLDQVLQGRVAGVEVENNTGAPGSDVVIRIRGANSILGNNSPLYVIDGFVGADFNTLNTNDIESIEVLKDASATALYGSRGSNGVILVTTKKGNNLKPQITFSSALSNSSVIKKLDLLDAYDFANVVNQRDAALNTSPTFTQAQINNFQANGGTNWQNLIFRNAIGQQYELGVSGGGPSSSYFISGNYLDQDGTIINSGFKKYALRSNFNSKISDKLSIRLNIILNRRENLNTGAFSGKNSPQEQAISWAPTTPLKDASGNYTLNDPVGSIYQNPVLLATDNKVFETNTDANILAGINYHFIKDLSLDQLFVVDYNNYTLSTYGGPSTNSGTASALRNDAETGNLQSTTNLTFKHDFEKGHHLDVTAAFEAERYSTTGFTAAASGLTFPNLSYNNLSLASAFSTSANYAQSTLLSLIGRINYSYKDKYLLTVAIRRDGSSKFQGNNQESTFPSIAAGWKLSEEPFIKKLSFFDELKLRGSWGVTGSQAIAPYATLATYLSDNYDAGASFNNSSITPGLVIGNAANPSLKWESTYQEDAGLDGAVFNNRLNFSFDYYAKQTKNLLLAVALPAYTGGGSIVSNIGRVDNSGIDISVGGIPLQIKNFTWTSNFNISFLKNKVISLGNQTQVFQSSDVGSGLSTQPEFVVQTGQSLGAYWGVTYLGTWKPDQAAEAATFGAKPGDSRYVTAPGSTTPSYGIIGNGMPKKELGWNNTFAYKSFSLNVFLQSLLGFDKLNYTYGASITANSDSRQTTSPDILQRYIPGVNTTSNIPAFSTTNVNLLQSSRFIQDGSFVRVKNINFSYNLPKSTIKGMDIKVFIGAVNLFTITKYKGIDPESTNAGSGSDAIQSIDYGSYPNSKTINAGFNIKF